MTASLEGLTPGTWTIDDSHTAVSFSVRHAGISKTRGQFESVSGELNVGQTLDETNVRAEINVDTINTGNADRDGHLKSADFFDIENHPTMVFESTKFGADEIEGNLTIKGVTKPVTFTIDFEGAATDPFGTKRAGFSAHTKISRKEFGLTWNAALEAGGVLVGDTVTITLDAEFTAPAN